MAAVSATSFRFATPSIESPAIAPHQIAGRGASSVCIFHERSIGFPSVRTSRLQICAAKSETVEKVGAIVREQLGLSDDTTLTPETKFTELGADSLDTVEIVMKLEEDFDINVEEQSSDNITTIQEAANLIDTLVQQKS